MASRPAFAALGCLQCRNQVLRAVISNSATFLRAPVVAANTTLRPRNNLHRAFSSLPPDAPKPTSESSLQTPEAASEETAEPEAAKPSDNEDAPWFLQVEPPTHAPTQQVSPLPELPESSPALLEPLLKYVYEEMGLDDLSLLDLRALDPPPALGPNLLMLFATARSERHLHVSSSRLVKWLRHHHRIEANADGLIGPGELKTKLRRMRRKAKLLGTSAMAAKGGDDGISTGWICINLGTSGSTYNEAARFDAEGKMSGFGGPVTGSTIVVQVMTESRRNELDLERLWSQQLIRSQAQERKVAEETSEYHNRFGKLPTTANVRARRPNYANGTQTRGFSTRVSRPTEAAQQAPAEAAGAGITPSANSNSVADPLNNYRQRVNEIRWEGAHVGVKECLDILKDIFRAPSAAETHAQNQADLATEVITTMHERGMPIMDHEMLVTIIEAIAASGSQAEKIRIIQSNLEMVMLQGTQSSPTEAQLVRLVRAYASQGNWEQLWETWSVPARYSQRRGPEMYRQVFAVSWHTGSMARCIDTLRKCVQEMRLEQPPVLPDNTIWPDLVACIRTADPNAEHISEHMVSRGDQSTESHKAANTEFVRMLKELKAMRQNI
ncbi:ATPase synthesis protein 25, mitochondrial [Colletotrichum liriopes]|uniref:ATPase synthesis protein 25 n=1 Tax=Colletotrichum liriopes TaxID=708192 RepID=A0AA37GD90_9PEZI|nr:ATPase synthesis protein 25, mitochondrial [Colletotrichum liriopes]